MSDRVIWAIALIILVVIALATTFYLIISRRRADRSRSRRIDVSGRE